MSSARLRAAELPRELEAAILGDFPRLERGSDDAQRFARAFSPLAGEAWWQERTAESPLARAAQAVSHERRGEGAEALRLYGSLSHARTPWIALLGLLLEGWSNEVDAAGSLRRAANRVGELRPSARKARLFAKISVLAADSGKRDFARVLWQEAIASSDPNTHLGRALRIEALNLGLAVSEVRFKRPPGEAVDPLVWPEQIEELRLQSATGAMTQEVEEQIGGTWLETIRFGSGPLAALESAEAQARWIGLPWMRRPTQKQLGAQLLAGGGGAGQFAHGALDWTLGGGSHYDKALRFAEPNFDHADGDRILLSVADCDPTRGRDQRLATLAAEAWDLVSDDVLRRLVDEIPPRAGNASPGPASRLLWAGFSLRLTSDWFGRYRGLEPDIQAALLDSLEPSATRHFDREMKEVMYEALGDDQRLLADGGQLLPFAAALAPRRDYSRLRCLVEDSSPKLARVISNLLLERPEFVSAASEARTLKHLTESLKEQTEEAHSGKTMMGGGGPRLELGRFLSVCEEPSRAAIDLLVETAGELNLPAQYLQEARHGLVMIRRAGRLSSAQIRRLRTAPEPRVLGPFAEGASITLLRAFLLLISAKESTRQERGELVAMVRSPEARVRAIATSACADALPASGDDGLAWALVSALFDPEPAVCEAALTGLPALTKGFSAAAEVAWQRLPVLLAASQRSVRVDIVGALGTTTVRAKRQRKHRRELLAQAREDRSWRVRSAAAEVGDASAARP